MSFMINPYWFSAVTPSSGLGFRYGYEFDGVDEGVDFSGVNLGLTPLTPFSVSLWVKTLSGLVGAEQIICQGGNNRGIAISEEIGVVVQLRSPTFVRILKVKTINSLDLYKWVNIVITYDGLNQSNSFSIYFDSVNQSYNVLNNSLLDTDDTNNDTMHFGYFPPSSYYSYKRMDDVQFFDYELTSTNVSDVYNNGYVKAPSLSPVHHWKLGEEDTFSTNWTVKDSVGSLDGTSVNMEEEDRKLGVAYSMDFDGVDEKINFGNILDFATNEAYSISFWFKTSTSIQYMFANYSRITPKTGYSVLTISSQVRFSLSNNGSGIYVGATNSYNFSQWNHILVTYDGSESRFGVEMYLNGVKETLVNFGNATVNPYTSTGNDLVLGANSANNVFIYNGNLMEASVFDSELSAADAALLYNTTGTNNGVPIDPRDVGLSPTFYAPLVGPNDSFSTNWTITDEINGNNGTSVNMEEADKTSDTP